MRILIVGFGSMGIRHQKILSGKFPRATIKILRQRHNLISEKIENNSFYSLEDASRFDPDLVVISNPAPFHIDTALHFARVGANLFIEKPISDSDRNVHELIKLCRSSSLKLAVGYNLRFQQSLAEFRRIIQEGVVGRPIYVKAEVGQYLPNWRKNSDYRSSVTAQATLGGGVLLELSHELDYLRWIFGEFDWVHASLHKLGDLDMDAEDLVFFEGGIGDSSIAREVIVQGSLDCLRHDKTRKCTVVGTQGTLIWDGINDTVLLFSDSGNSAETLFVGKNQMNLTYEDQWDDYMNVLNTDRDPVTSGEDALKTLEVLIAIRESSRTRSRVDLNHKSRGRQSS